MSDESTTGAVFEARFVDGTITRMSTWTSLTRLDLRRAIKLSNAAYEVRKKKPAVAIIAGRFELGGEILHYYSPDELREESAAMMAPENETSRLGGAGAQGIA